MKGRVYDPHNTNILDKFMDLYDGILKHCTACFVHSFKARVGHCRCRHFYGHKSPAVTARELFTLFPTSARLLVSLKNLINHLILVWCFLLMASIFLHLLPNLPEPRRQSNEPLFWLNFCCGNQTIIRVS